MLYAGTSGFSYPAWRGVFYPERLPASRMLAFYAERLNGVELNGSFYRTPPEGTMASWAGQVPPQFRFCLKAARGMTYSGDAFDRAGLAREVGSRLGQLGARLGPVLLQFPPTRQHDPALLDRLLSALDRRAAVELRHESWFREDVYAVLRTHGAALVVTARAAPASMRSVLRWRNFPNRAAPRATANSGSAFPSSSSGKSPCHFPIW